MKAKIINKIRKLLALGGEGNPNTHERVEANDQARRIMEEHHLELGDIGDLEGDRPYVGRVESMVLEPWGITIIHHIGKLFHCKVIAEYTNGGGNVATPFIIGRQDRVVSTVEISKYVIRSCIREGQTMFCDREHLRSFNTGASIALYRRIDKMIAQQNRSSRPAMEPDGLPNQVAVVRNTPEKANEDYLDTFKDRIQEAPAPERLKVNPLPFMFGEHYGKTISLHRQLEDRKHGPDRQRDSRDEPAAIGWKDPGKYSQRAR